MDWLGFDADTDRATRRRVVLVLLAAVLGVGSSAVLVRAMVAPALAIAAWRTLGSAALLSPALPAARSTVGRRDLASIAVAGAALGLHFWAWFASLEQTTVLRSTVLVCLVPAWTAALEWALWGVRPRASHWLGLAVALPGFALLAGTGGEASASGDLLAVLAGILWSVYLLIGRQVRQRVQIAAYMGLVCLAAAALLFPLALWTHTPLLGWPAATWALIAAAILGPQLVGHQGFNYAVRYLPATTISSIMLLEPVGATLLAAIVLREVPHPAAAVGALLVLVGITVATRRQSSDSGGSGGVKPSPPTSTRHGPASAHGDRDDSGAIEPSPSATTT